MRRKLQIKGYTRVSGGKAVKVKPHSRMAGKDGVNSSSGRSQSGDEFRSKQSERSEPTLTKEEWDEILRQNELKRMPEWRRKQLEEQDDKESVKPSSPAPKKDAQKEGRRQPSKQESSTGRPSANEAAIISQYKRAPQFAKDKMLNDPVQGAIIKKHLGTEATTSKKPKAKSQPHRYSSQPGLGGALNRLADNLNAWAERHSRRK